ncbi:neuroglobin-like isoform X3 [Babylonia areolata]|uniref:neuroglobin-like isoform X3 n=1 Tax=Babylonia areolata TaxID=304850 RepID=UPI003FD1F8AD
MGCRQTKTDKDGGGGGGGGSGNKSQGIVASSDPKSRQALENGGKGGGEEFSTVVAVSSSTSTATTTTSKTCEKLGVSAKQLFSLRQSWKGIRRNMDGTGVEMFVRLFKSNGDLKNMFHAFKDLSSDDDMRSNESLENHATLVMTTLDDAITHIDNFDYVSEVLRKTGASHVRFEGFTSDNFWNIREPFLEAVKITLGDRYTDNMEGIYKVAISFILQTMSDGMDEAIKAKAQDNS